MERNSPVLLSEDIKSDKKHLIRRYFFASAALDAEAGAMKEQIMQELNLNESQFQEEYERQQQWWLEKIDRSRQALMTSPWAVVFKDEYLANVRKPKIPESQALELACRFLNLALQKVSLKEKKNHLKKKDRSRFLSLLEEPMKSQGCLRALYKPLFDAGKGKYEPTSRQFALRMLAAMECLSDFYGAWLHGQNGAMNIVLEQMKQLPKMDLELIQHFLGFEAPLPDPESMYANPPEAQ